MAEEPSTLEEAIAEIEELRSRLEEAEEAIHAIRSGEVDALVVSGPQGEQVYTLVGAERTYRILVEAMSEGALVLSPEGVIVYSNRTFAAMLGAPLSDVLGSSIYSFITDEDVEAVKKLLQRALKRSARAEVGLKHPETGSVPAHLSVGSLETEDGPAVSAVVTDLTEHHRTEAELQQYREHLEELVAQRTRDLIAANEELATAREQAQQRAAQLESFISSMADGVALFDVEGNTLLINDAGRAIIGGPPPKSLEEWAALYQRVTQDDQLLPHDQIALSRALRGETVKDARYKIIGPSGTSVTLSISASPVRDSEGRIIGATNVFRDITDEVEFERYKQELYDREHYIAEMLQQALIPSQIPYDLHGISIAATHQPALREAQVGGDFYDIFELGEHKIGVLIGDVAGKGLRAAIRVAAARYSIRSYAYLDPSPGRVLALANAALLREGVDTGNILTVFFGVVDVLEGTITYASAGHEPPVVWGADNRIEELEATGAILGVIEGATYHEHTRRLRRGDTVVMFTDGITEARGEDSILFGQECVIEHLTKMSNAQPQEIVEALLGAATAHAGGSLQDDAAILVLGYPNDEQV